MPRLTKSETEKIIIDFVKGKPTPGYEVVELSNGKYQVKEVKIIVEVEEEDQEELQPEPIEQASQPCSVEGDPRLRPVQQAQPQPKPSSFGQGSPATAPKRSGKQNALELLKQLTAIMEDDAPNGASARWGDYDEQPSYEEMTYQQPSRPVNFNQNWNRKRLRF